MPRTASMAISLREGNREIISRRLARSFDETGHLYYELPNNTTDQAVPFSSTTGINTIEALYILSDQNIDFRQTASDAATQITANQPFVATGTSMAALLLSNNSGSTANIEVWVGGDNVSSTVVGRAVRFADNFSGANAGLQIQAAIDDLPAAGGVVDARGFSGAQTITATVAVGTSTKPVTLLLGAATFSGSADPLFIIEVASEIVTIPATIIRATSTNTAVSFNRAAAASNVVYRSKLIGGGEIDGNSLGVRGVLIRYAAEVEIDITARRWLKAGIALGGAAGGGTQNIVIRGYMRDNIGAGILLEEVNAHNDIYVQARLQNNKAGGFVCPVSAVQLTLIGDFEGNGSYGTVDTSGTAVTWVSGDQFNAQWPQGAPITIKINGVLYSVASVNSAISITLATSAGTQTGVAFAFGSEVAIQQSRAVYILAYCETNSGSNQYVAIQFDGGSGAGTSSVYVKGAFFQNVGTNGVAISLGGQSFAVLSGEIGPCHFASFVTAIEASSATVDILPQNYVSVTNQVTKVGTGNFTYHRYATATLNFAAPGAVPGSVDLTIALTGVALGDSVAVGAPVTVGANYLLTGFVSAADVVTVRWTQIAGAAADPDGAGGTYRVDVWRH